MARRLYCRHRHPLARNNHMMPSDPRASLRRRGRFIRTPGDPANLVLATEQQAEILRNPSSSAMAVVNERSITPPLRVQELVGGGGRPRTEPRLSPANLARNNSWKEEPFPCPRTSKGGGKRSRILPEVCFILILLFQDPM